MDKRPSPNEMMQNTFASIRRFLGAEDYPERERVRRHDPSAPLDIINPKHMIPDRQTGEFVPWFSNANPEALRQVIRPTQYRQRGASQAAINRRLSGKLTREDQIRSAASNPIRRSPKAPSRSKR